MPSVDRHVQERDEFGTSKGVIKLVPFLVEFVYTNSTLSQALHY